MRAAKQIHLASLRPSLLSEVTDVSFVPRKLTAHWHSVPQPHPFRSCVIVTQTFAKPLETRGQTERSLFPG
jgi:hypothetical protein